MADLENTQNGAGDEATKKQASEEAKDKANSAFKKQDYPLAIELYSKAIDIWPTAVLYANRSIAHLKTESVGYALTDASKAIELDKNYVKAYYRRAAAYMALGKFKQAMKDFEAVVNARPSDKDAKMKLQECSKIVRKLAFEKAIAVDDSKKAIVDTIDIESMALEDSYTGPRLEEGKVTVQFMKELMEWYKNQKVLHRKFAYKILIDIERYFQQQPTLVDITIPHDKEFTVCGDIHGQYYDLLNIFKINGLPSEENPYLCRPR